MLIRFALAAAATLSIAAGRPAPATIAHETVWFRGGHLASGRS
jgi:hypothetical protein